MSDAEAGSTDTPSAGSLLLDYPFQGRWLVQNSPARRVPSHGTDLFGSSHAIDFVPVGVDGRSLPITWRTLVSPEQASRFVGFGRPILAPIDGVVALVHDGEVDHDAYRTLLPQVPYALTQGQRVRAGGPGLAGNHVVIEAEGGFVLLAHLRQGSVLVAPGQAVGAGEAVGACGNSGNSTEPHVHVQVTDSPDWTRAQAVPVRFRGRDGRVELPDSGEVIEA